MWFRSFLKKKESLAFIQVKKEKKEPSVRRKFFERETLELGKFEQVQLDAIINIL